MPQFFVPYAKSPEEAERVYAVFVKNAGYPVVEKSRLFSVDFPSSNPARGKQPPSRLVAEVGKEIRGWPERDGVVLGIVETPQLLTIHTHLRGGLSATPIMVGPEEAGGRIYFDDFPGRE